MSIKMRGVKVVNERLNNEIKKLKSRGSKAMIVAGLLVEREAKKLTPVDLGPLKAGYKVVPVQTIDGPGVIVFNTKEYAGIQHENLQFKHTVGEAKFLEKAIDQNQSKILNVIANGTKF